jgi:hypothetical protein
MGFAAAQPILLVEARHPSRLAELVIGPATSGRTRWLAPQDDGGLKP